MIEVFTTNIQNEIQANHVSYMLENVFPELKINFDLNETNLPYPCGHTILRIVGNIINTEKVLSVVHKLGFRCDILEDKICN